MLHLVGCFHWEECGEADLDVLEVLQLGDEGGQHAVAQVARHQLSVHTSHLRTLQCIWVLRECSIFVKLHLRLQVLNM